MTRRKLLFACGVLLLATIGSFLIMEFVLRLFFPQQESMRWFQSSERYGYITKPNFNQDYSYVGHDFVMEVRTNSLGHRAVEYDTETFSDIETGKILLLGDSFVFGYGVNNESHIAEFLKTQLKGYQNEYLIINAGVGGWGTLQELLYARDNLEDFQPDVIVLVFCGNDPVDDDKFVARISDNQRGMFYFPGKVFIRDHSHTYRFLFYRFHLIFHKMMLNAKAKEGGDLIIDEQSGSVISDAQWTRSRKAVDDFHADFIRFNPSGFLLILNSAPWNEEHNRMLRKWSRETGPVFLDLYDQTKSLSVDQRRLEHDGHWSGLIHKLAADAIAEAVFEWESRTLPSSVSGQSRIGGEGSATSSP